MPSPIAVDRRRAERRWWGPPYRARSSAWTWEGKVTIIRPARPGSGPPRRTAWVLAPSAPSMFRRMPRSTAEQGLAIGSSVSLSEAEAPGQ